MKNDYRKIFEEYYGNRDFDFECFSNFIYNYDKIKNFVKSVNSSKKFYLGESYCASCIGNRKRSYGEKTICKYISTIMEKSTWCENMKNFIVMVTENIDDRNKREKLEIE